MFTAFTHHQGACGGAESKVIIGDYFNHKYF